jgi:hypothetical protein
MKGPDIMEIKYCYQFNKALSEGAHAWPGGYPRYFVTADGGALSFASAEENAGLIRDAIIAQDVRGGWCVCGVDVNWEDNELTCDHSGARIECAYPPDDDEEKAQFVAGWNMPGYMPDNPPEEFATFDAAKRYIIDAIKREEDEEEDEEKAEALAAFAEDVNLQSSPFGATCGRFHYFVSTI